MNITISLAAALLTAWFGADAIRKRPQVWYAASALLSVLTAALSAASAHPAGFAGRYLWPPLYSGSLACAFFMIVMWTGALPNGSAPMKRLMPIRGELSVITSILVFGHALRYLLSYGSLWLRDPSRIKAWQYAGLALAILMTAVMMPLFVTSFKRIRRRMDPKRWKKLQRWAYLFYALLCVHVMIFTLPRAMQGRGDSALSAFVYSAVFISYVVCRLLKSGAVKRRESSGLARKQLAACAVILLACAAVLPAVRAFAPESTSSEAPVTAAAEEPAADSESENRVTAASAEAPAAVTAALEGALPVEGETAPEAGEVQEAEDETASSEQQLLEEQAAEPASNAAAADPAAAQDPEAAEPAASEPAAPAAEQAAPTAEPPASASEDKAEQTPPVAEPPASASEGAAVAEQGSSEGTEPAPEAAKTKYRDGTYSGSGDGYVGRTTVSVTIQGDRITSIVVTSYEDDEDFFADAKGVIGSMLSSQSADVSAVSGATGSSYGIMRAVKAALASALNE